MQVIKRDGRIEPFDYEKIQNAVEKACKAVGVSVPVFSLEWGTENIVTVDQIHDKVEKALMVHAPIVAKAYILYRNKRNEIRMNKSSLMQAVGEIAKTMHNDNANTQNSSASKMYGIAEAVSKIYFLSQQKPLHAEWHKKGKVYQHDLGYYGLTWNCFFNPLGSMLANGFTNGVGTIRPPKRIGSAVALACIILQSSQNSMFGGQGFLRFDTDLAPYVAKEYGYWKRLYKDEKLAYEATERATYQAMEAFIYNMNTMRSRSGAQVTFSSVNFGTDIEPWAKMVSRNLLKAYIAGLGHGENPIFPNLCYKLKDGVNLHKGEPNFDLTELAIECVGKRIQPRFVFCDSPAYAGMPLDNIGTMGCRTAVRGDINTDCDADTDARGNLFFHTINLPYLALESEGCTSKFFENLNNTLDVVIDELLERYDVVKNLKVKDVPFVSQWWQGHRGLTEEDSVEPMIKHGSLAVGFVGLAECLTVLTGKHHGENKLSQSLGLIIIERIREATDKATKKYHLNFSCFATPAESACYTLLKAIRNEFGVIAGVSDKEYLTNSFHVPVSCNLDLKEKLDIEAPYHLLCNGGAIFYSELGGSPADNPEGVLKGLQNIAKSGVVYGGLNFQQNQCRKCGTQFATDNTDEPVCPHCGSHEVTVTRIITGYLSTLDKFNAGKVAESNDRVAHKGDKNHDEFFR